MKALAALAAWAIAACLLFAAPAGAGFVTGVGASRTAHLSDALNGLNVSAVVPELIEGSVGYTFNFLLAGTNATAGRNYRVEVVISPGSDTEARFNATGPVPGGQASTAFHVTIAPDVLKFTTRNTPFAVELRDASGGLLDSASFSVDLEYKFPPADGGLLALALASLGLWGLVFLYALNLHSAQRKLRAKAEALEHAQLGPSAGVRADGEKR